MSIYRNFPQVRVLLQYVEKEAAFRPVTHEDFVKLGNIIFEKTRQYISDTTLERVWGYSTRGYENISMRTLNLLCLYIGDKDWDSFCRRLQLENPSESDMFDCESIQTSELDPGAVIAIGWQPDRVCKVRYLGDNRFETIESVNAKLKEGDTFSCLQFQLGSPLILENIVSADGELVGKRYGAGLKNGLTMLRIEK